MFNLLAKSAELGPGSLQIGSGVRISDGVNAVDLKIGGSEDGFLIFNKYNATGSELPTFLELGARTILNINDTQNQTLADPFEIQYTTVGDNLTYNFDIVPAEEGDLLVTFYDGIDDTGSIIFQEIINITPSQVNQIVTVDVGNKYVLPVSTNIFVRFSGIQLKGGVAPVGSPFEGQTIIYFQSRIQGYIVKYLQEQIEKAYGQALLTAPTSLTLVTAGVDYPTGGTFTDNSILNNFTTSASGRLTYNGTKTASFLFNGSSDLELTSSGTVRVAYKLVKNGGITLGETPHTFNALNKIEHISITAMITLEPGDYLEVKINSDTNNKDITIDTLNTTITKL